MTNNQETVTISLEDYIDLLNKEQTLEMLYHGGVSSWDWYDDSIEGLTKITSEDFLNNSAANDNRVQVKS